MHEKFVNIQRHFYLWGCACTAMAASIGARHQRCTCWIIASPSPAELPPSDDGSRRQKQEGPKSLGRLPVRVHDRPIEAACLFCPCLASQASSDLRPPMLPSRRSQSLKRAKPKLGAPSFVGHLRFFHTSFAQTQVGVFDHSSWSPK